MRGSRPAAQARCRGVRAGWDVGGGAAAAVFCVVDFFALARAVFLAAFTCFAEAAAGPWKLSGIQ